MRRHALPLALLTVALVAACPRPWAATVASEGLEPVALESLHFGDALFHFFQDDYFEAIVRTEAYASQGRLQPHRAEAELLLGGLYLSYGQHTRAAAIFEKLLADAATPQAVRDRAWFHLGKVMYARGYFEQSGEALGRAGSALPQEMAAERTLLLAQGLMKRGRFDEAARVLGSFAGPSEWRAFGQFNLGVALVRGGRVDEGLALLDAVGQLTAVTEEMKSLRDKANVALGYALLQADRPSEARMALERVRLDGPQASKALLGAGWADAEDGQYEAALAPWLELHDRGLLDAAVQESWLAVPYAFARLTADGQAAGYYEQAIAAYAAERRRLDESIEAIRSGRMLERVIESDRDQRQGWFWQLSTLPDAPESRYLYHLLAGNEFQEALKHYRSLDFLGRNLERWAGNLDVFAAMVESRRLAYEQKLPAASQRLGEVDIDSLDARRDLLRARLDGALRVGDWAAFADGDELRLLDAMEGVESTLAARPDDAGLDGARDKARLARGVLSWRLETAGKERAWRTGRSLRQLDAQLFDARTRFRSVTEAMSAMPGRNDAYATRIAALRPRVEALSLRVAAARQRQGNYLAHLAIQELELQKVRLAEYSIQARYALAALYDRGAAMPGEAGPGGQQP